jgi:hypothetical protein
MQRIFAELSYEGKTWKFPVVTGTGERSTSTSRTSARTRAHHPDKRLLKHRLDQARHHLHRLRQGQPQAPRLPHRGVAEAGDFIEWHTS